MLHVRGESKNKQPMNMPIQSSIKNIGSCMFGIVNLIEQIDIFPIFAVIY